MHDDLKRRLHDEVTVGLESRPERDLADVLRRGRGKRLGLRLITIMSTVLLGTGTVTGGMWVVRSSSPSEDDRRVQPVEEDAGPSEPTPCPTHDSAEHAGPRCIFGGEVRFRITTGWAEQFESRLTSAMRMAPESLLLYDNAAGTAPMAALRVIANPALPPAVEKDEERCPHPDAARGVASADAIRAGIQADTGLHSTAPVIEKVGGVDAQRIDLSPAAGASTCRGLLGVAGGSDRGVPVLTGTRNDYFGPPLIQVVQDGMKMRLYVMDLPPGRSQTLSISIVAAEEDFDAAVAAAEPLLDTFEFHGAAGGSTVWSPLQERGQSVEVRRKGTWQDPLDASVGWVDVKSVGSSSNQHWAFELAAEVPRAALREPGRLLAYGVVLDTDRDGDADYEIGIDNDTPELGDLHVWVTDLATGETEEQFGPPYGAPIDFAHPAEADQGAAMIFFFLPGSAPLELTETAPRFYVWAAEARDGEIIASDYAPDTGWMSRR